MIIILTKGRNLVELHYHDLINLLYIEIKRFRNSIHSKYSYNISTTHINKIVSRQVFLQPKVKKLTKTIKNS